LCCCGSQTLTFSSRKYALKGVKPTFPMSLVVSSGLYKYCVLERN
jgi:hypothetical protein